MPKQQNALFKGVYDFEDPSGTLLAARVPSAGAVDLYDGTKLIIRPNQVAILIYNGKVADVFFSGNHELKTDNIPLITKLLNWKYGFQSSLLAEIWFFGIQVYPARRWGTPTPFLASVNNSSMPLRAHGTYSFRMKDPRRFYATLVGSRTYFDVTQVEEFIQSQMLEALPKAIGDIKNIQELNSQQKEIADRLETNLNSYLDPYGIEITDIQLTSILPPKEILEALEERIAMELIGNKQDYLLYKTADALENLKGNSSGDASQMLMGMMMGQGFFGTKNNSTTAIPHENKENNNFCTKCGAKLNKECTFCGGCGAKI